MSALPTNGTILFKQFSVNAAQDRINGESSPPAVKLSEGLLSGLILSSADTMESCHGLF